jgi:hypothetical protein
VDELNVVTTRERFGAGTPPTANHAVRLNNVSLLSTSMHMQYCRYCMQFMGNLAKAVPQHAGMSVSQPVQAPKGPYDEYKSFKQQHGSYVRYIYANTAMHRDSIKLRFPHELFVIRYRITGFSAGANFCNLSQE